MGGTCLESRRQELTFYSTRYINVQNVMLVQAKLVLIFHKLNHKLKLQIVVAYWNISITCLLSPFDLRAICCVRIINYLSLINVNRTV